MRFECLKCGECCKNLINRDTQYKIGIFLTAEETKLFPPEQVIPLYGTGIKGKSRPRPQIIFAWQLTQSRCPHLTKDNLCSIYNQRPLSCKSYPVNLFPPILGKIAGGLDDQCRWVRQNMKEGEIIRLKDLKGIEEETEAQLKLISIIKKAYQKANVWEGWVKDLKDKKWKRL